MWGASTSISVLVAVPACFMVLSGMVCNTRPNHLMLENMQRVNCSAVVRSYAQYFRHGFSSSERSVACWAKGKGLMELNFLKEEKKCVHSLQHGAALSPFYNSRTPEQLAVPKPVHQHTKLQAGF
jgi:hypothetical protein